MNLNKGHLNTKVNVSDLLVSHLSAQFLPTKNLEEIKLLSNFVCPKPQHNLLSVTSSYVSEHNFMLLRIKLHYNLKYIKTLLH